MFSHLSLLPAEINTDVQDGLNQITTTTGTGGFIFYVISVIGLWAVFSKAGRPGILAIIPIVNVIITLRIVGRSGWLVLLYLIPIVNIVMAIIVAFDLGRKFGKGGAFSFFLLFLFPFIGYLILGFGQARYTQNA
ncbi:membrane-bound ClpP family serine protease [Mycetocola sp. BIGb0189]|uniref:DUF5684 domain-containing protein n=1 Tax=Mycetocola TaxID=76634 RepID=UPI001FE8FD90|nr:MULTISPECIES: DUF5684 domain-containing protein [Mycetocola]MCS4275427.1 membrane-bound ClpP family serine protease [Mycetocola sp. BIGb0189]